MITRFICDEIDPFRADASTRNARTWGAAIPRCGAELIGHFAPHDGSGSVAADEADRAQPAANLAGRWNCALAAGAYFVRRADRSFRRPASAPHAPPVRP